MNGTCAHHWIIEPPDGAYSVGRCQKCGAERSNFANSEESITGAKWGNLPHSTKGFVRGMPEKRHRWPTGLGYSDGIAR